MDKDDLHPSLAKKELGVWTMVSERKTQFNFAVPTIHSVGLWGSELQGSVSVLYPFLKDCRRIFGIPLSCAYMGYQLLRGLEKTALLYVANQVMQTIEAGIVTRQPDVQKIFWTLGLQLGIVVVSKTADWAIHKLELSMKSKLKRHFMLLQMQSMLRLDYPTFQSAAGDADEYVRSEDVWHPFEALMDVFRYAISATSQLWIVANLTRKQKGSLLFAALCLAQPVFTAYVGDIWSLVFVAHAGNEDYKRSTSFYQLATQTQYKQEVLTGGMDSYVLNEYGAAVKNLGNKSEEHPYFQLQVPTTPIPGILTDILGELPTLYYALHVMLHPRAMSLASLAMLQQTSRSLNETFSTLSIYNTMLRDNMLTIRSVYDGLKVQNTMTDGVVPYPNPDTTKTSQGMGIEIREINFAYPNSTSDRLVLRNISFTIKPSSMVVIVGANGSGKSTLVKLLSSLYPPTSGSFLIDNLPSSTYRLSDLRQSTALLTQDHNLFPLTLGENIGVGDPSDVRNMEKTKQAAELGGAADFIGKMEKGFEETVDQQDDVFSSRFPVLPGPLKDVYSKLSKKSDVSGGEKQRLVASRTFRRILSGKMRLVLVDEPTSAMDPEGEFMLFERLRAMKGENTMVFVTHRFGHLTKHADLILCMKDGELVESGTHRELIVKAGEYYKLYNIQAQAFSDDTPAVTSREDSPLTS